MEATTSVGFLAQATLNKRRSLDLSLLYQPQSQSEEVLARVTEKAKDLQLQALGVLQRQTKEMILKDRKIALLESQMEGKDAIHLSEVAALQEQNSTLQEQLAKKDDELKEAKRENLALTQSKSELSALKALHEESELLAAKEKLTLEQKLEMLTQQLAKQESSLQETQEALKKSELKRTACKIKKKAAEEQAKEFKSKFNNTSAFCTKALADGYRPKPHPIFKRPPLKETLGQIIAAQPVVNRPRIYPNNFSSRISGLGTQNKSGN